MVDCNSAEKEEGDEEGIVQEEIMAAELLRASHILVNETLRLHQATPLLIPHLPSEDCTIGEYNVPRNIILLVNAWAIHRHPNLRSEPTCFRPERFEKEGEEDKLRAFRLGRWACLGTNLAQRIVGLTLGLLIQCFEWNGTAEEEIDMAEGRALTVPKKIPLEAMCKVRHHWQGYFLTSER